MQDNQERFETAFDVKLKKNSFLTSLPVHIILFVITFITTLIAGISWTTGSIGPYTLSDLKNGLPYALSVLFMLSSHEFGHYFAAKYHKVKATLPYYIPFPPLPGFFNFGTMGAVIKTRTPVLNNKAMFDIGIAGPLAGFVACLILIIYGFTNLPGEDYILAIHPDFFSPEYGKQGVTLAFGDTLLFSLLRDILTEPGQFIPPMSEIYHYPYLCVGWFGLFVTAMNMIPVGQLDGGHIVYSMFGSKKHEAVASISMIVLGVLGFLGVMDNFLELDLGIGWIGWLFWAVILLFFIKIKHPPVRDFYILDTKRMILGYISLFILIISFSPTPFLVTIH